MGRCPKYDENYHPILVKYMTRCGMTDKQIAKELGVGVRTFYRWKKTYTELSQSLKESKDFIDALVEESLLKKAIGYEIEETEIIASKDGSKTRVKKTKRWVHDTTAAIFWLKNRRPDRWRDVQSLEHSGDVNKNVDLSYMSDEELESELEKIKKELYSKENEECEDD